jgi:hypothetical protein
VDGGEGERTFAALNAAFLAHLIKYVQEDPNTAHDLTNCAKQYIKFAEG